MNMKKAAKIIIAGLLLVALLFSTTAYASNIDPDIKTGDPGVNEKDAQGIINFLVRILRFLSAIGGIIIVGAFMLNGYKLASPNPNSRAEAMQGFMYTVIGGIIVFGAYYLAGVLKGIADSL